MLQLRHYELAALIGLHSQTTADENCSAQYPCVTNRLLPELDCLLRLGPGHQGSRHPEEVYTSV